MQNGLKHLVHRRHCFYSTGFEDLSSVANYSRTAFLTNSQNWSAFNLRISNSTSFTGWKGNGSIAAALRNGSGYMQTEFTITNLHMITLYSAIYGTDIGVSYQLQVSIDKTIWIPVTGIIAPTDTLTLREHTIDFTSNNLVEAGITKSSSLFIRIKHTGSGTSDNNNRLMVDDVLLGQQTRSNTPY
jgi:hypothetical protein